MGQIKLLGIAGSLRHGSYNRAALQAIKKLLPEDVEINIFDLHDIPFFNEDVENSGIPAEVENLNASIAESDAIIIATPEYNYSIPAALKNALDWGSRGKAPLRNKPTAILSASPGAFGGARVQYHLRQVCVAIDMKVLNRPEVFIMNAHTKFDEKGNLTDEKTQNLLKKLIEALLTTIQK